MRTRLRPVLLVAASFAFVAGCAAASPSVSELRTEPLLAPIDGEVLLLESHAAPRRARVGVGGRDGAVERVVALADPPALVADLLQRRHGERYGFARTELGQGTPNTVELRGRTAAGIVVVATASTRPPLPLFTTIGAVRAAPADRPTSLVITVISRQ